MKRGSFGRAARVWGHGLLWCAVAALAAATVACGNEPVNPASPSALVTAANTAMAAEPASQGKPVPRRVEGVMDGRFSFTRLWGDEWWQFYSDGDCSGTLTHLGLARLLTTHIPDLDSGALTEATFTIIAANGDEIRGTYAGVAVLDAEHPDLLAHGTATFVITAGSGRFSGATGSFSATFLETFDDPYWLSAKVVWTLDGSVTY